MPITNPFNATVPETAPILPVQAYIDCMMALVRSDGPVSTGVFPFSNKGITSINTTWLNGYASNTGAPDLIADGNAITNTNAILAVYVAYSGFRIGDGVIDLSGGTNAAPTGQGLTDKATLIAANWTVTTN